jgi:hypothetical protein
MSEDFNGKRDIPLTDFDRLKFEVKPCDIILVEGLSRIARTTQYITGSPWSHAAIYIGRIYDIENETLRNILKQHSTADENTQFIIESYLGKGTVLVPLNSYENYHLRICRPDGLTHKDSETIIEYMIDNLGIEYNVRHFFDLMRFILPWRILPKRWGSSLFESGKRNSRNSEICSSLIAHAFTSVNFPILPKIELTEENKLLFKSHNPNLYMPKDFDYSPYFKIIKYPILKFTSQPNYQHVNWQHDEPMD